MLRRLFKNSDSTGSFGWIIAETLVVVLGILIAFQLEAWREEWRIRADERIAISSIIDDLNDDDAEIRAHIETARRQELAFNQLSRHFDATDMLSDKDLVSNIWTSSLSRNWRPSAPTYEGLKETGKLDLISDVDLRNEVINHFDGWETYLGMLSVGLQERTDNFMDTAVADFVQVAVSEESGSRFVYKLVRDADAVPTHPEFRGRLGQAGSFARWVVIRLEEGLEYNQALREKLTAHLDRLDES